MTHVLNRIVTLHRGERATALLMFCYSFLAMTAWNILRPLTKSKFINALGAENAPYVLLVAGVLIGLLMHQYTRAIQRLPRAWVIPVTQAVVFVLLIVIWAVLRTGAVWITVVFYFVGLILGILLISQFWTVANDIYDARQAKRLFGFIGGGASLGGAFGAQVTATFVKVVGADNMVLIGAAAIAACAIIVMLIARRHDISGTAVSAMDEQGVGAKEAFRLIRESKHLKIMALVIACSAAGAQIIDQQLNMVAEATKATEGAEGIAQFLAQITVYVSLAGFLVQVVLTRWIHRSFGLAVALLLLPVSLGATGLLILLTGALWAPQIARVLDATLRYTIDKTTREVLFLPLAPDLKFRAKPFIDVTADRGAKALTAVLLLVLIQPWGLDLDWRALSYASVAMTSVWVFVALAARRQYLRTFRQSIGSQSIAPDAVRLEIGDAATIEALVEELSNPDAGAVLYAIGMLETLGKRRLISPLLLQHESPAVRVRVLRALGSVRSHIALRWKGAVERMVHDPDVAVRAAALRALAHFSKEDAATLLRAYVADPEPAVIVTACVGLARSRHPADVDAAEATLKRLIADVGTAGTVGRRETALALAHITAPRFRPLLVPLLYDHDITVVQIAIRSARTLGADDGLFLPALISRLGDRTLKVPARDALIGYGTPIIPALALALADTREDAWVRRHIPATLAAIPSQASMDALIASLDDPDSFLRFKSIVAIERLRGTDPALAVQATVFERLVLRDAARYLNLLAMRHDFRRHTGDHDSLLARTLDEKLERTRDRVYRLLGLLYGAGDVAAARHTIEHGEARHRAAAVEYLDNLLTDAVRKRVLPILDETPESEKLRHAYLALKTRPRDLEETLAQLVHETDSTLATAAVHFIASQALASLGDDLEYLLAHWDPDDRVVIEAAAWGLRRLRQPGVIAANEPLPVVELAHRMRMLPLFEFVSVDELFRMALVGEEARHPAGRELCHPGAVPQHVEFLIEGTVCATDATGATREIAAPAALWVEEVLQGAPAAAGVRTSAPIVSLQIAADTFLTMVSDNALLAKSLFRMKLAKAAVVSEASIGHSGEMVGLIDGTGLLRDDPLLSRATPPQMLALIAAGREVPLIHDAVAFDTDQPAAVYQVIEGELLLESGSAAPRVIRAGVTICVAETLTGLTFPGRATVTRAGRAMRLERDDLFAVLTDHVDLLQGLFGDILASRTAAAVEDT